MKHSLLTALWNVFAYLLVLPVAAIAAALCWLLVAIALTAAGVDVADAPQLRGMLTSVSHE